MKRIIAIPVDRLCPHCGAGRMIARGTKRETILGEFDSVVYRECSNPRCKHRTKCIEKIIGVEIEEPEFNGPTSFDAVQHLDDDIV